MSPQWYRWFFLYWVIAISVVLLAIKDRRGKFSLRTLLIAMTLIAVGLGVTVYMASN